MNFYIEFLSVGSCSKGAMEENTLCQMYFKDEDKKDKEKNSLLHFEMFATYSALISFLEKKLHLKKEHFKIEYAFEGENYELEQEAFAVWKGCGEKVKTYSISSFFFLLFTYLNSYSIISKYKTKTK